MRNARLDEAQTGIKIAWRNINNVSYADDTTLMAESEEALKSLLFKVKEESEKVVLKLNVHKTKIMASGPITSWQICKASSDNHFAYLHFFFLGMAFITASCTMSQTSIHSSSGTLSDLIPSIYFSLPCMIVRDLI